MVARTWCICFLALLLAGITCATPCRAQQQPLSSADTLHLRPLSEVLLDFQAATGVDLYYETSLIDGKWVAAASIDQPEPQAALDALLDGTGLYSYRMSTGTYAIKNREPASPPRGSLIGVVEDAATGAPIADAHVLLLADRNAGAATNENGRFVFNTLPAGTYLVQCTHVGYEPQVDTMRVPPSEATTMQMRLVPRAVVISPIIVEGLQASSTPRFLRNTWLQERVMPARGFGTSDAVRALGGIIGVRTSDATADVHIQGGETGEHQFRLDGVPVFEPVHLRGLLGAFNPFALERIQVHKAGFGASEGSQISGVIEAQHLLASPEERTLDVQVDPLSINGRLTTAWGARDGVNARVMLAARRSLWDVYAPSQLDTLFQSWNAPDVFLLNASLLALEETTGRDLPGLEPSIPDSSFEDPNETPQLGFADYHAAARIRLAPDRTVHTSFYRGTNTMSARRFYASPDTIYPSQDIYEWSNTNGQLTYSDVLGPHAFWQTRLRANRYRLSHGYITINNNSTVPVQPGFEIPSELTPVDDDNHIREVALESSIDVGHASGLLTLGLEAARTNHRFNIADVFSHPISNAATTWRVTGFVEEVLDLTSGFTVTPGLRTTYLNQQGALYAEPRFEVRYESKRTALGTFTTRLATGLYRQFTNQFDVSSVSPSALVPGVRFWMPVDSTVAPPKAYHVAGDLLWHLGPAWSMRLESYYKDQPHILAVDYPALLNPAQGDTLATMQSSFLRSGEGQALGAAVAIERSTQALRTQVRYEYAVAEREYAFQDRQRGVIEAMAPVPWSEPQRLEVAVDWLPVPALITTLRWQSAWQRSWGYRQAYYDYLATNPGAEARYGCPEETDAADAGPCVVDLTQPDAHLLPPFHQLDVAVAYTIPVNTAAFQIRLDVLNALDRDNVADWSITTSRDESDTLTYQDQVPRLTLPRTVSLALRLKW